MTNETLNMDTEQINNMDKSTFKDGFIVEEKQDKTIRRIRKCKACKNPNLEGSLITDTFFG